MDSPLSRQMRVSEGVILGKRRVGVTIEAGSGSNVL